MLQSNSLIPRDPWSKSSRISHLKLIQAQTCPSSVPQAAGNLQSVHLLITTLQFTNSGSLLLRFYNPTGGRITLNGVDICEYNVKQVFAPLVIGSEISSGDIFRWSHKNQSCSQGRWLRIFRTAILVRRNNKSWLRRGERTVTSLPIFQMD